jgi:hypothetical protein
MIDGMELSIFSHQIDSILISLERDPERATMLFDRYVLLDADGRDAFVAALIHRVLTERARRRATNIPNQRV